MFATLLQTAIQLWVRYTGKQLSLAQHPWLEGPIGGDNLIGERFYETFAKSKNLSLSITETEGLLADFSVFLSPQQQQSQALNPRIANFYEQTARFKLEVWSEWYGLVTPFAKVLIQSVSRKMHQLNIPLSPLETSWGMSSQLIQLRDSTNHQLRYTCWLRKSIKSGRVVYAGFYTTCQLPGSTLPHVKVVFPLPKGNVTVILRVEVQPDGSVKLLSAGKRIGEAGYYRTHWVDAQTARVKYIPLKESIYVFVDETGTLRTDHEFAFMGMKFLHLHYKIN